VAAAAVAAIVAAEAKATVTVVAAMAIATAGVAALVAKDHLSCRHLHLSLHRRLSSHPSCAFYAAGCCITSCHAVTSRPPAPPPLSTPPPNTHQHCQRPHHCHCHCHWHFPLPPRPRHGLAAKLAGNESVDCCMTACNDKSGRRTTTQQPTK
jgi:hypothetical protein